MRSQREALLICSRATLRRRLHRATVQDHRTGLAAAPAARRKSRRRSWAMASKQPTRGQRRVC